MIKLLLYDMMRGRNLLALELLADLLLYLTKFAFLT